MAWSGEFPLCNLLCLWLNELCTNWQNTHATRGQKWVLKTIKWNDGRRVVEIGVLEEGLICTECQAVLSLLDITEET